MENLSLFERYLTKSSTYGHRSLPSSRISFATGTRFNNKFERRLSDMIKKSTYNIKPIRYEKDSLTRYRAPAATIPVGPYQSVTKRDYSYPSEDLLRSMNPQPKWIYRSKSDLGSGRILDQDYQFFNSDQASTASGNENSEKRNESQMSKSNRDIDTAKESESRASPLKDIEESGVPVASKEFSHTENEDTYYAFFKPLVGDSRDRYIENACMKRAVEGVIIPLKSESKYMDHDKKPFVPRQIRFTDSFNKVFEPRKEAFTKLPTKLPALYRNNTTIETSGGRTDPLKGSELSQGVPTTRMALYQKAQVTQSLDRDMIRTYEKQAKLREMIQK